MPSRGVTSPTTTSGFSERMRTIELPRHLLGELFIEQLRERLLCAALRHDAFAVRHGVTHRGEHALHEETFHLKSRLAKTCIVVGLWHARWQRRSRESDDTHRTTISQAMAPMARSDSKIAATSFGCA